jgi:predicted MFS family arabinose efflux permease
MTSPEPRPETSVHTRGETAFLVGVLTLSRFFLNIHWRMIYPFAPAIARGLNTPLSSVTRMIAVTQSTAMIGLLSGPLGDRWGYRTMLLAGTGALFLGAAISAGVPVYGAVFAGVLAAGVGKVVYAPAAAALVGERVPFRRRGLAVGFLETSWAASALIGLPTVGWLIGRFGWRSPFLGLSVGGALASVLILLFVPKGRRAPAAPLKIQGGFTEMLRNRAAVGILFVSFFLGFASDNLFVVYGLWFETDYHLSVVALGMTTTVVGLAELLGEAFTAAFADRIGLMKTALIFVLFTALTYALLPLTGKRLVFAVGSLFLLYFAFETTIVTTLSLVTEVLPAHRGTMLAGYFAASGLGRVVGALSGGPLFLSGGISAVGFVSAAATFLGFISLTAGILGEEARVGAHKRLYTDADK